MLLRCLTVNSQRGALGSASFMLIFHILICNRVFMFREIHYLNVNVLVYISKVKNSPCCDAGVLNTFEFRVHMQPNFFLSEPDH